jgi:hypothetical protein
LTAVVAGLTVAGPAGPYTTGLSVRENERIVVGLRSLAG